jgi:flagellar basal body-associated protein FliL
MNPGIAILGIVVILIVALVVIPLVFNRKRHVMSKADRQLYKEAARILNRLVTVTDLDGDFAADIVSPTTRKVIDQWLVDYRKEIEKA